MRLGLRPLGPGFQGFQTLAHGFLLFFFSVGLGEAVFGTGTAEGLEVRALRGDLSREKAQSLGFPAFS